MSAATTTFAVSHEPRSVTLLELVQAVLDSTDDDREVIAVVGHLLRSGRVRLCGNFRDVPLDAIL